MGSRLRTALVVAIGVLALTLSGVGIATAAGGLSDKHGGHLQNAVGTIAADEEVFTYVAPCRLVDTRVAGGQVSTPRSFVVSGTSSLAAQGGSTSGCTIPKSAKGIAANVVATGSTADGYLKAYPAGTSAPTASTVNYGAKQTIANGVTLGVTPGTGAGLTVSAFSPVNVVIDVTGYYSEQITAYVNASSSLGTGTSRVVSVTHVGAGDYRVNIDRYVDDCSASITPVTPGTYASGVTDGSAVDVNTWTLSSTAVATVHDETFNVTVTC